MEVTICLLALFWQIVEIKLIEGETQSTSMFIKRQEMSRSVL